jgi:hypothetical protein
MRSLLLLAAVVLATGACARPAPTAEQQLLQALEQAHAPLAACVDAALAGTTMPEVAVEFAASPRFGPLLAQAPELFTGRGDLMAPVFAEGLSPAEQAERLLSGLRSYGEPGQAAPAPGSMDQALPVSRLVRRAVADVALAPLPSIDCPVPPDVEAQIVESRAAEVLIEISSAYAPYQACVTQALGARSDIDGRLPELLVARGVDASLQQASRRYLGRSVDTAALSRPGRVDAARTTLQALGAYGAAIGLPGQPYPDQVRRRMAMVETMQLMATATDVDCSPGDALPVWMEVASRDYL